MAYFVSAVNGGPGYVLLAGPFNRHGDALRMVNAARRAADDLDPREGWHMDFGTCRVKRGPMKPGRLNARLDLPVDGTRIMLPPLPRTSVDRRTFLRGTGPAPTGYVVCDCDDQRPHFHPIRTEAA